ncbi:hypothetical protein GCM10011583_26100 [Streptomyces camponoticapitis]|uniref:LPXTG cell wall anchor domain-containing protein n=1 Tax=Streptomyces camponoticapitis TaxID=1616125 RepID=A0ABQ2E7V7_9ACTN|nr:LPXTG cell wall anchor domain-containing protein [Streptomyces camponoticapitis]GGJ93433.1 hypothetical protein GCM10011583_26100 [Streptomyces camponoticapitis]
MKLRRAMAVAAATAVMAPAAFLAAPAAYAADGDTGATGTTQNPPDENPPPPSDDGDETPPSDDESEVPPADDQSPPSGDDGVVTPPADEQSPPPGDDEVVTAPGKAEPPAEDDEPATPGGEDDDADDGDENGEEEEPTPPDEECADADFHATLSGLPSAIVAGSGWKKFDLDLDNTNGEEAVSVDLGAVVLYKKDAHGSFESSLTSTYARFEYYDGEKWVNELSEGGSIAGRLLDVEAGETYSLRLRLKIAAKAPAGSAVAIAFAVTVDKGKCALDEKWYSFQVLAAGTEPVDVPPAEPEKGESPADVKPQGGAEPLPAAANGSLAETGSNSLLPAVGTAAGLAVVAGGGLVFALRRRGGDAAA